MSKTTKKSFQLLSGWYNSKKLLGVVALLFNQFSLNAQNSQWMQQAGGQKPDEAYSISTDNNGNTYTTGYFTGNASFGSFNLNTIGVSNVFVTKTDNSGHYIWAVQAGGNGQNSRGLAIKTDGAGNSYITGWFYGIATFGSFTLTSKGKQDVFIAKYNANGTCLWAVRGGGNGGDIGNAISIDNKGYPVVTGEFQDTVAFGSFVLTAVGNNVNVFTGKLDSANGNYLWVKSGTGPHSDRGLGIACDPSGNVYVEGSFTDTITFDVMHKGSIYNAIFLLKYSNAGNEIWFTTAAASQYGIANAIAADANNHIYLTGDFQGTLTFFWKNHVTNLSHRYSNRIFVCKYDTAANLLWDTADASSNWVTSRSIAVDNSGNATIIGHFRCVMNSYADRYGQGTFNSVGFWDVFVSRYNSTIPASWQWSQQIGGDENNYGWGVTLDNAGNIYTCGSYDLNMILPIGPNYLGYNSYWASDLNVHCSDPFYGAFQALTTRGNLDIFIAKPIDFSRQPYDFYYRSANSCSRPSIGVCATDQSYSIGSCKDTVQFCVSGDLYANSNAYSGAQQSEGLIDGNWYYGGPPGPYFRYHWSNGSKRDTARVSNTGWYQVTQTSWDSCSVTSDSVYVIIHPLPQAPTISDNVVINHNSANPLPVKVCRDSVLLTGGNYGNNKYFWSYNNMYNKVNSDSLWLHAPDSNDYYFNVVDSFGCMNSTRIRVVLDSSLPHIVPKLYCQEDPADHDSVSLCVGDAFSFLAYDSIKNPNHNQYLCIQPYFTTKIYWHATPNNIGYAPREDCEYGHYNYDMDDFYPASSGWYNITATIVRSNACDSDTHVISDSIYVTLHPNPVINLSVRGSRYICPGGNDSALLIASCNYSFMWWNGSTKDSIWVKSAGTYDVTSSAINQWGCYTTVTQYVRVDTPPQPLVTMSPANGIICPNDSVFLHCSGVGNFQWKGPLGPFGSNQNYAYANVPGLYYCVLNDTNGCTLLSNTVILEQYTTPFLWAYPSPFICQGDSIAIHVGCSPGSIIQWQAPLFGNDTIQWIKHPGIYTCKVTSCGITTVASITIGFRNVGANISVINPVLRCPGDSAILSADTGMSSYLWLPGNYNTRTIVVKSAGTYTLIVTDSGGCKGHNTVTIQSKAFRDSIAAYQNIQCYNNNNGSITIGVSGGTPPYTYQWSPIAGSTATVTGLSAGTYTVQITDSSGCTTKLVATIKQPLSVLKDSIFANPLLCCNSNTGSASVIATGGWGGYKYLWTPTGQTNATATSLSAGTYTVSVTDSGGCNLTTSVTVTQPPCITLTDTVINANCREQGQATVYASGGVGNYTYSWNPGGQTTATVTGLSSGSYTVTVTDSNGCTATIVVKVGDEHNEHAAIKANPDSACRGENIILTASGGDTYVWSNAATSSSIIFTNDSSRTWWVLCTYGRCTDTAWAKTYCYSQLQLKMPKNNTICIGQSDSIAVTVTGGKPTYTYVWNNGISENSPGPFIVAPTASAKYVCNITDGCNYNAKDSVFVTVTPKPTAIFALLPDTVAAGDAVNFINQSKDANSYIWSFGDGNTGDNSGSFTHLYPKSGSYLIVLTAYSSHGCADSASKNVYVEDEVIIPNIFTPNGDGKNDIFMITISESKSFKCQILNRWGDVMYEWNDINAGWDGRVIRTGELAPEGEYYYILDYHDKNNTPFTRKGIFSLIR